MNLISSTAIALVAALAAAPAAAQYNTPSPAPQQQRCSAGTWTEQRPAPTPKAIQQGWQGDHRSSTGGEGAGTRPPFRRSWRRRKAVAQNKDDHFAIGALQFEAAKAANDQAGMVAGADEIAASGYLPNRPRLPSVYTEIGVPPSSQKTMIRP